MYCMYDFTQECSSGQASQSTKYCVPCLVGSPSMMEVVWMLRQVHSNQSFYLLKWNKGWTHEDLGYLSLTTEGLVTFVRGTG